jgi:hypothetical protein
MTSDYLNSLLTSSIKLNYALFHGRAFLERLIDAQPVKEFPHFKYPDDPLPYISPSLDLEPVESNPHLLIPF